MPLVYPLFGFLKVSPGFPATRIGVACDMSHTAPKAIFLIVLAQGIVGCGSSRTVSTTSPSAPSPPSPLSAPQSAVATANSPATLVVFREPATGFSTTDLRDAHDRIIQLTSNGDLIWTPDGTRIPGYEVSSDSSYWGPPTYFIGLKAQICVHFCAFSVRFGASNGERRAYMTIDYGHDNPGTLVDVEVRDGALVVSQTALFTPGSPTLSGRVTETTATGEAPVAGAWVARYVTSGAQSAVTDQDGVYRIFGLIDATDRVRAGKEGYNEEKRDVTIQGDTRFDIVLVRR